MTVGRIAIKRTQTKQTDKIKSDEFVPKRIQIITKCNKKEAKIRISEIHKAVEINRALKKKKEE